MFQRIKKWFSLRRRTSVLFGLVLLERIQHGAEFICWDIDALTHKGVITEAEADRLKTIIHDRLGDHGTVGSWVSEHIPETQSLDYWEYLAFIREYRIRWLMELIKEFSAKGD